MESEFELTQSARQRMVRQQLAARGICSTGVLRAMGSVPRERFVPEHLAHRAFDDQALPISCDQTISQPYIVALMTQALNLTGFERVLEVGTGSGYQTAVLAELAQHVDSVERHTELSREAERTLRALGYTNITLHIGDGTRGLPELAPFDSILIAAAGEEFPQVLWEQLKEGGVLVGPFGPSHHQQLVAHHKVAGQPRTEHLTSCRFVPLVSDDHT